MHYLTNRLFVFVAHVLFCASSLSCTIRFLLSSVNVHKTQQRILDRIIKENRYTEFGKEHSFDVVSSIAQFQMRVPVRSYDDFLPFINKILVGEQLILTKEPVLLLEPTSGSSGASKLIPYTRSLKSDFHRGINPWIVSLYMQYPSLFSGSMYWAISPLRQKDQLTKYALPVGFQADEDYFNAIQKWVINKVMAVPKEVGEIIDVDTFRYATNLFLVARKDLKLISVWSPTYISFLLKDLPDLLPDILEDLKTRRLSRIRGINQELQKTLEGKIVVGASRIKELEDIIKSGNGQKTLYEALWPKLTVISAWQDGSAKDQSWEILSMFPHVYIQPKGLLSTEACLSFPFFGNLSVLSVCSHFFEFQKVDETESTAFCLAHELKTGKRYKAIITTSGGLYRYDLGDIVEVTGFFRSIPIIRFQGRDKDKIVDLVGEKLNENFVDGIVTKTLKRLNLTPRFWMMAPRDYSNGQYGYVLFIEFDYGIPTDMLQILRIKTDTALKGNYHYELARRLGQLIELDLFLINSEDNRSAYEIFLETSYRLGQRLSTMKQTRLHHYIRWNSTFSGYFLNLKSP